MVAPDKKSAQEAIRLRVEQRPSLREIAAQMGADVALRLVVQGEKSTSQPEPHNEPSHNQ